MAARQAVLGMEQASFYYGSSPVFRRVSFLLDGARTALVGENGAGKSTLLKCLTGALELNGGKVVRSRGLRIGSVPQDVPQGLAERPVRDVLYASLARVGLDEEYWRIDVLMDEIGVEAEILDRAFGTLSGGWQRLLLVAAAARLEEPDILVLDEPTNHLDLANINTLERWLTVEFAVPMLIVSHDREFLNRVTERTLFLRSDGMHAFKARFSQAREELLSRDASAAQRARLEDKEIRRLEQAAARYKAGRSRIPTSTSARTPSRRASRASRRSGRKPTWRASGGWSLADGDIDAKVALRIAGLDVSAPGSERKLLASTGWPIAAGDRIALLGVNGAGKSTLLSALAGAFDPALEHYDSLSPVRFNPACRLVYFDQSMRDLALDQSILDYIATCRA